jgi:hypothetical protein
MKKSSPHRSKKFSAQQTARLGAYLAAGLGVSGAAMSTSEAELITINIGPDGFNIGGVNAGLGSRGSLIIDNFPFSGAGPLIIGNYTASGYTGLYAGGISFAINGGLASPHNFAFGDVIDPNINYPFSGSGGYASGFRSYNSSSSTYVSSPVFETGSYMGFRTPQDNYGWLQVTWDGTNFQILSGAYQDQPGVAILAGAEPIPEPGTWAAAALLAGGAAFARWRKRRNEAQKEAA